MSNKNVGHSSGNPEENVRNFRKLEEATFNSIRNILPDHIIVRICKEIKYEYRNRLISPIVTVLHMLLAAIWPEDSFNASWQVLWKKKGRLRILNKIKSQFQILLNPITTEEPKNLRTWFFCSFVLKFFSNKVLYL